MKHRCTIFIISLVVGMFAYYPSTASGKKAIPPDSAVIINNIILVGNHVTKRHIVLRELTFSKGDTIALDDLSENLDQSKNNLLNTSLFNFATLNPLHHSKPNTDIYIILTERWYIWPFPILEYDDTNFNTWWKSKDFSRINYGFYLNRENFRGRKEALRLKFQMGYTQEVGLQYEVPFLNKEQTNGLGFTVSYQRRHQIVHTTSDNKRMFYSSANDYARTEFFANAYYQIRKKLYNRHTFQLQYTRAEVADTIVHLNRYYFSENTSKTDFFTLAYEFRRDKRDSRSYPLKGYYFDAGLVKNGLGITNNKLDLLTTKVTLKRFWEPFHRTYLAAGTKLKVSNKTQPYYLRNGLGYNEHDFVRGYEYYVIDGESFLLGKAQLRYKILSSKVMNFNFIPLEQFNRIPLSIYAGIYGDAGYVNSKYPSYNPLANEFLYGIGMSVDFVTYYDLVLRTEYSLNKFGEHGLFLHFVAPI